MDPEQNPTNREKLHQILTSISGVKAVYFQQPPTVKMEYPCIVYQREAVTSQHADGLPYVRQTRYKVTVIDPNPDSVIHLAVGALPTAEYDRFFTSGGLNHDIYTVYF